MVTPRDTTGSEPVATGEAWAGTAQAATQAAAATAAAASRPAPRTAGRWGVGGLLTVELERTVLQELTAHSHALLR
ncbi:hypothetical protein GCM10010518_27970 [Kitasatospora cinereorecta]